jgi:G3E family GTPase
MSELFDHDSAASSQVIPVTVLTGFLGAGKTTLLNRILGGDHGLRIAVLVNDFGSINIDAELVVGVEGGGDVISLANGCVCCNIRDDLLGAVQQTIDRPERPEYIVLEASGVAEPSGIAATFLDLRLRDRLRLDSIMCVVDASQIFAAPEMLDLKLRQIAFADMLILNKTDLVESEQIAHIRAWLNDRFHHQRLAEAIRGNVPMEILLGAGRFDPAQLGADTGHRHDCADTHCDHPDHGALFETWSYENDEPLSLELLRDTAGKLPASIYRCKGVINSAEAPERRSILQVVGRRVDLTLENDWCERPRRTRLVAIGAHRALNAEMLRESFDRCVASRS